MTENVPAEQQNSDTNPTGAYEANDKESSRPKLPYDVTGHSEGHNADRLTFFGFAPLRKRLNGHAVDFLLNHRRWAKPEDPPEVVAKKNVIIMFTIHAEVEDCLVRLPWGDKVDKSKPLVLLHQLLGISYMKGPRSYTFVLAILKAYTNSRYERIMEHLFRNECPPEPEAPMDKVLLSFVDRRLVFKFTMQPLHTIPVSSHRSRLQHHRLKLEELLCNASEVDKAFTAFKPTVPQANQKAWQKPWHVKPWLERQERMVRRKFDIPQPPNAPEEPRLTENNGITASGTNEDFVNTQLAEMAAMRPDASMTSCGIYVYNLGAQLACNHISVHPAPEVAQAFADTIYETIERFAKHLEIYLASHPPDSVGQYRTTKHGPGDIARVTTVIHAAEVDRVLVAGINMTLLGVESEQLGLLQWSWIATEVYQGKAAIEVACEESLSRGPLQVVDGPWECAPDLVRPRWA